MKKLVEKQLQSSMFNSNKLRSRAKMNPRFSKRESEYNLLHESKNPKIDIGDVIREDCSGKQQKTPKLATSDNNLQRISQCLNGRFIDSESPFRPDTELRRFRYPSNSDIAINNFAVSSLKADRIYKSKLNIDESESIKELKQINNDLLSRIKLLEERVGILSKPADFKDVCVNTLESCSQIKQVCESYEDVDDEIVKQLRIARPRCESNTDNNYV